MPAALPLPTLFWRAVLALLALLVTWLALVPAPPDTAHLGWDKLNHLAAFAALAFAGAMGRLPRSRLVPGLLAHGALIELLQALTPTRQAEWADLLADAAGVGAGLLLAGMLLRLAARVQVRD